MFDVGLGEMVVLVVLSLVIFGDRLPTVAAQAGRTLRQLRTMANSAKADLQEGLGPEFKDFDIADLNPKTFVRKHLFDGEGDDDFATTTTADAAYDEPVLVSNTLEYGERPPFDSEAT